MSTHEPFEMPKQDTFSPYPPEKKGHGCWFYGCITLIVLLVLMIMAGVIIYFQVTKFLRQAVEQYTATTPEQFPPPKLSEDEQKDLEKKVHDWSDAVERGDETEPLVLDSDQLNALIATKPDIKGKVHVDIKDDEITGRVSIPLDELGIPMVKGRYLNGSGTFDASIHNGFLVVRLQSLTVKGQTVPEESMVQFRNQNLAEKFNEEPDNRKALENIESLEIKDGKVIIKARAKKKDESKSDEDKAEKAKPADEDKTDKAADAEKKTEAAPKETTPPADEPKKEAPQAA